MWPFSKKNRSDSSDSSSKLTESNDRAGTAPGASDPSPQGHAEPVPDTAAASAVERDNPIDSRPTPQSAAAYDPVNGDFGPFDGDHVDYSSFDYSDFAKSGLDLGSLRVPVPHSGEVQVEMGPKGPQMIHILTPYGRLTPVVLAAPRSGNQWEENIQEVTRGMVKDGLEVRTGQSLWGTEIIGTMKAGTMRVIGVDGPRWMLRMTLAGPADRAEQLSDLAYEVISRTFVYRGDDPLPAGQALPVTIPAAMAEELKKVVEQRKKEAAQKGAPTGQDSQGEQAKQAGQGTDGPAEGRA